MNMLSKEDLGSWHASGTFGALQSGVRASSQKITRKVNVRVFEVN